MRIVTLAKRLLPPSVKRMILGCRRLGVFLRLKVKQRLRAESVSYVCPCCGTRLKAFQSGNYTSQPERYNPERYKNIRQDILCPVCLSLPRHRILAKWCEENMADLNENRILYFAPEYSMSLWLRRHHIKVKTADLFQSADLRIDMMCTGQPDASWDMIICNHVLEHVPDYKQALRELYRILAPGGRLICSFPIDPSLKTVLEDVAPELSEKERGAERWLRFGQIDHLRIFGRDAGKLLEDVGFSVSVFDGDSLPPAILPVVGPADYDANRLFVCEKPAIEEEKYGAIVSVIVPVFNVSPFLYRCIRSIVGQSYRNLQIVLVDDGSTDGSGDLCDEWVQIDPRIMVIHQENRGLSAARNAGLKEATGDYICFVDSDDFIHRDMILRMLTAAQTEGAEAAACLYRTFPPQTKQHENRRWERLCVDGKSAGSMLLREHAAGLMVWNKLYSRSMIPFLTFSEGHVYEGKAPLINAMIHCSRVVFLPDMLYYYTDRSDSISHTVTLSNEMDRVRSADETTAIIRDNSPELMPDVRHLALKMYTLSWMRLQFCREESSGEYASKLREYIRLHRTEVRKRDMVGFAVVWMTIHTPSLCRRIYRCLIMH